jgi:hypothetical protein
MANSTMGIQIVGDKELNRMLLRLPDEMLNDVLKKSTKSSATKIRRDARKAIDTQDITDTKLLRDSLSVKVKANKRLGTIRARVWPNKRIQGVGPDGRKRVPYYYAHLVEFGYRVSVGGTLDRANVRHKTKRTGTVRGHVPARPFLRPALDRNRATINREFDAKVRKFMVKAVAKAEAKNPGKLIGPSR